MLREFLTSLASYCLVKTLYTLQETAKAMGAAPGMVNAKNPPGPGPDTSDAPTLASGLHNGIRRTVEKLGDPAAVAFIALDEYTSKAVDLVANLVSKPRGYRPYWQNLPGQIAAQLSLAAAAVGPNRALYLQQAKNTRYIFVLVRNNPEEIGIPKQGEFDLAAFQDKAYGIGDFENIWSVEGLGHVYSQRTWILKQGSRPATQIGENSLAGRLHGTYAHQNLLRLPQAMDTAKTKPLLKLDVGPVAARRRAEIAKNQRL